MRWAGVRVAILGAGRSGRAAARLLGRLGARPLLLDDDPAAPPEPGIPMRTGPEAAASLGEVERAVLSPGLGPEAPLRRAAARAGLPMWSEVRLAASLLPPDRRVVAVTGTNGKSTVVHFTATLLEEVGLRVFAGGNLGVPLSEAVGGEHEVLVLELSSFQLERPTGLRPAAATILNLAPDHLDRHGDLASYAAAKARVFEGMAEEGWALLPRGEPLLADLVTPGRRAWIGARPGVLLEDGRALLPGGEVDLRPLRVPGPLAALDAAVACFLAAEVGVPLHRLAPGRLRPLPHRLQPVHEADGITWVDDSKATNVHAVQAALAAFDRPLVVLLGGRAKPGDDPAPLVPLLAARARAVVGFGESGERMAALACRAGVAACREEDLAGAVRAARGLARPGDVVLLSPGGSSFDAHADYRERGRAFGALARGAEEA